MVIRLEGSVPSKKNTVRQSKTGRRFNDPAVKSAEIYLGAQIPAEAIGLLLEHPDVTWELTVPKNGTRADRDNKITMLIDLLVKFQVFKDDSISRFNGRQIYEPVKIGEDHVSVITIEVKDEK